MIIIVSLIMPKNNEAFTYSCKFNITIPVSILQFILNISNSFIAALLFYIITDRIPFIRKSKSVVTDTIAELKLLCDNYRDLSGDLCGGDWCEGDKYIQQGIDEIIKKGSCHCTFTGLCQMHKTIFKEFITIFDYQIRVVQTQSTEYLTHDEFETLVEIKNDKILSRIRHSYSFSPEVLDKNKINELVEGLAANNKKILALHASLEKRFTGQQYFNIME